MKRFLAKSSWFRFDMIFIDNYWGFNYNVFYRGMGLSRPASPVGGSALVPVELEKAIPCTMEVWGDFLSAIRFSAMFYR